MALNEQVPRKGFPRKRFTAWHAADTGDGDPVSGA